MQDFSQLSSKTVTEVLMLEMKMAPAAKAYLISGYPRSMRDVVEYSEKVSFHIAPATIHPPPVCRMKEAHTISLNDFFWNSFYCSFIVLLGQIKKYYLFNSPNPPTSEYAIDTSLTRPAEGKTKSERNFPHSKY